MTSQHVLVSSKSSSEEGLPYYAASNGVYMYSVQVAASRAFGCVETSLERYFWNIKC